MPQYVLVDRQPVFLSKHKINVIAHGRPLSPIGSLRSISPYVPKTIRGSIIEQEHGDTLPTISSASFMEYQKSAQANLININNNLSAMLQETCSGIDNICQKVRLCLLEANSLKTPEKEEQQLSVCEEEPIAVENEEVDELEEETVADNEESFVNKEESEEIDEIQVENTPKRIPSLTPFFTVLNPKTKLAESVGVKLIKSITSKLKLSRTCTAANFHKTMKRVEKLSDYEKFLSSMVDDVNKEIEACYKNCQNNIDKQTKNHKRPKSSPLERSKTKESKNCVGRDELNRIQEIKKFQKDYTEDHFSENDLLSGVSERKMIKKSSLNMPIYTSQDVYRKRAITDLHQRLVAQVEANDSLIFFQKLMAKNRKYLDKNRPQTVDGQPPVIEKQSEQSCSSSRKPIPYLQTEKQRAPKKTNNVTELAKKYQDSLWFKQQKNQEVRRAQKRRDRKSSNKACLPQTYSDNSGKTKIKKHGKSTENSQCSVTAPCKCKISVTNNQPLSNSDTCKIHWMRAKYSQMRHKKLKYLDILDDVTRNDLIPLNAEYPRRDEIVKITDVKDSYLYKLLYGKGKETKKAWSVLMEPSLKCSKENCQKCSELNVTDQKPLDACKEDDNTNLDNKRHVIRTLSKYIFLQNSSIQTSVFTVMPVHVFYDNARLNPRRPEGMPQKLPLLPMKETKEMIKKGEWSMENSNKKTKPMKVVYDPILRKIDKEIRMVTARHETRNHKLATTNSWSPKHFNQYCAPHRAAPACRAFSTKTSTDKVAPKKGFATSRNVPVAEIFKRVGTNSPNATPEQFAHRTHSPGWNSFKLDPFAYQRDKNPVQFASITNKTPTYLDLEVKKKIEKDVEAQMSKHKTDYDRKMWENKYGKSVGQKLLTFIEKQPEAYELPVPKYALPRKNVSSTTNKVEYHVSTLAKPVRGNQTRQQQMLNQIRTLKQKNDNIQNNIQKAIEVIENKMMDILCNPTTKESIDAFDEMEKEITHVLGLMKTPSLHLPKVDEDDNDVNKISEELFKKLDKILDSPGMLSSGKSSKQSLLSKGKSKIKLKPPPTKSSDMNQVCFSSTSASGEEKFTITAISPKRAHKVPMTPPFIKSPHEDVIVEQNELANISEELRKLRNELKLHEALSLDEISAPEMVKHAVEPCNLDNSVLLNRKNIVPVQQQVVNLALVKLNQECSAGDQLPITTIDLTSEEPLDDEPSYSIGDGDSLLIQQEKNKETIVNASPKEELKEESSKKDDLMIKVMEPESSGPYFTPQTSPLIGTREECASVTLKVDEDIQRAKRLELEELEAFKEDLILLLASDETDSNQDDKKVVSDLVSEEKNEDASTEGQEQFYQNVNKIISRVESVYNQLEQFEEEMHSESLPGSPPKVFHEPPKTPELETDAFLTPFMHAVKELRKTTVSDGAPSRKSSPRLSKSPSYFNVLTFLDNLTDFKEEKPIEVHTSRSKTVRSNIKKRILNFAYVFHLPTIFHQKFIEHQATRSSDDSLDLPKKKSSCLKKPSSHLNMNTFLATKSKQKVSFLLEKEEKATQVTACPLHCSVNLTTENSSNDSSSYSSKKDEQVSAYLDALQNKSVDKMSQGDDESTYQSTLEFTDDISDKNQMPEQLLQNVEETLNRENDRKENVVEIFRSEDKAKEKIKVFYDCYRKEDKALIAKLISGYYNESSIIQLKKSLNETEAVKKRASLGKLTKTTQLSDAFLLEHLLREPSLLQPLSNIDQFVDTKLLKQTVKERQKIRMMRRRSLCPDQTKNGTENNTITKKQHRGEKEGFLKGIYAFVYLLMFTALNLEYKCVN